MQLLISCDVGANRSLETEMDTGRGGSIDNPDMLQSDEKVKVADIVSKHSSQFKNSVNSQKKSTVYERMQQANAVSNVYTLQSNGIVPFYNNVGVPRTATVGKRCSLPLNPTSPTSPTK